MQFVIRCVYRALPFFTVEKSAGIRYNELSALCGGGPSIVFNE